MKTRFSILSALLFCSAAVAQINPSNQMATIIFAMTNGVGQPDTNYFLLYQVDGVVLANGGVRTIGFAKRCYPNTNGIFYTNLMQGFWQFTNSFLGKGVVFQVPANTNSYTVDSLGMSGYNTYRPSGILGLTSTNGTISLSPANGVGFVDLAWTGSGGNIIDVAAGTNIIVTTNGALRTISSTASGGGTGTVSSVALTMPSEFSVAGSPITGAGTLAVTKANESANLVFAGPASGAASVPTFRSLVNADIPGLSWTNSATAVQEVNPTLPVLFGYATNGGIIFPTGTNTLFQGVQTNAYGGLYTNLFQLQAIDMRGTRTVIGIGADNPALTNNQAAADDSTYIGYFAGGSELGTSQQFNTAISAYALATATNGSGNSAIGQKSMTSATNANSSSAIGAKSLASCLYPARDTAISYAAMQFSLGGDTNGPGTGGNRTAIGYISGQYDDGLNNTWIGAGSGPQAHAAPANITGIGLNVCQSVSSSANGGTVIGANSGGSLQQFIGVLVGNGTLNTATGNFGVMIGDGSGTGLSFWNRGTGLGSSLAAGWTGSPVGVMLLGFGAGNGAANQQNNICIFAQDDGNAKITDVFFNNRVSASASSFPITLNAVGGNGSNIGGAAMNVAGGISTGNANGGDVNIEVALPGSSSSSQNALTSSVNVSGNNGVATFKYGIASSATNTYSVTSGGFTNTSKKTIRVFGFTGTSVNFSNGVSHTTASLGTITTPSFYTLDPNESLTGSSCASALIPDF